jgi:putative phosphoribosyl transferase
MNAGTETAVRPASVDIPDRGVLLEGDLAMPDKAKGVVLFAHGSGSSRFNPRILRLAEELNVAGLGTLLFDLVTPEEAADPQRRRLRFDIGSLAQRLIAATLWAARQEDTRDLPIGYFGAGTGATAALIAAAAFGDTIHAVVSCGGRLELAGATLPRVLAPTLLILGGHDEDVLRRERAARERLRCCNELVVVPGATHPFEETGSMEEVSRLASSWFERHFSSAGSRTIRGWRTRSGSAPKSG